MNDTGGKWNTNEKDGHLGGGGSRGIAGMPYLPLWLFDHLTA